MKPGKARSFWFANMPLTHCPRRGAIWAFRLTKPAPISLGTLAHWVWRVGLRSGCGVRVALEEILKGRRLLGVFLELAEREYMVRASGYLQSLDDFRQVPLVTTDAGVSVRLGDVARIQMGPEMRRGIGELDGEGEATGGVIVMRSGKNALETINLVKAKLESLKRSLPPGVEIVPVYDRSDLIHRAIATRKTASFIIFRPHGVHQMTKTARGGP